MDHYQPGCSKYNPIEHRLFCHVTRSLQSLSAWVGLRVFAEIAKHSYEKDRKATPDFRSADPIDYGKFLPELNYTAPWVTQL